MSELTGSEEQKTGTLLEEYSNMAISRVIAGEQVQVLIGDVRDQGDHISVDALPGCERGGLLATMLIVTSVTGKPTRSEFEKQEVVVEPITKEG